MNKYKKIINLRNLFFILIVLDAVTTIIGVGFFGKTELNPINYFFFGDVIISVILTHIFAMLLIYFMIRRSMVKRSTKGLITLLYLVSFVYFIVVVSNTYHILLEVI